MDSLRETFQFVAETEIRGMLRVLPEDCEKAIDLRRVLARIKDPNDLEARRIQKQWLTGVLVMEVAQRWRRSAMK